jgi:hypothetical protein
MSQAPNYDPTVSFATEETNQVAGRSTVRTTAIDNELANISSSINALNTNLQLIQRDDGKLLEGVVETFALSEATRALIAGRGVPRGEWQPSTDYAVSDVVQDGVVAYLCYTAHTSGLAFSASGFWITISGDGSSLVNAQDAAASAAAALASENAAELAETNAETAETNAEAAQTAAAISANAAANSATSAATSAGNASNSATAANTAKLAAEAALDSFDDRYLGAKAANPALDNDGNALVTGVIYFNTTVNEFRVWTGGVWQSLITPADASVTTAKIADSNVTTSKLADDVLTAAKLADSALGFSMINGKIVGSVAANALTIAVKTLAGNDPSSSDPVLVLFRNSTLTDGSYTAVSITSATTLVVSSGSTLGTLANILANLVVLLINNAGTAELAISNLAGGVNLDGTGIVSTTAEGGAGAADSATVVYSTTARSNVAYRPVALMEITQVTPGTWATAHTKLTPISNPQVLMSLGYGQTWQDLTASRALGTTYYNTTGKPIAVHVRLTSNSSAAGTYALDGITLVGNQQTSPGASLAVDFIVQPNKSYSCNVTGGTPTLITWNELR